MVEFKVRYFSSGGRLIKKVKSWNHLSQNSGSQGGDEVLRKAMKRYGRPEVIVTDLLRSYLAAMKLIGIAGRQETGRWKNNRAVNSHQPFRRREGAMAKFRSTKSLQKFTLAHASVHNHFNQQRHLHTRRNFKLNRSAALAEWRQMAT